MKKKLLVIGIGPGNEQYILPAAVRLIEDCDIMIGGKRNLELFSHLGKEQVSIGNNLEGIRSFILEHIETKKIAVLVTGDPGLYSMMAFLKDRLENVEIEAVPGVSSLQYLCSRLKLPWDDMHIASVHGRERKNLIDIIKDNKKVAVFTGGENSPDYICRQLVRAGMEGLEITVGENLSYANERIVQGSADELSTMKFEGLSVMIVQHGNFDCGSEVWNYKTQGIPDDMFIRTEVPMTKSEVRAVSLSKLRLSEDSIVYDIGAGTGSVSVECALVCKNGRVFAVERNIDAVRLIQENAKKYRTTNVYIIPGEAPDALNGLPAPDRVFIGGSGGNMDEIFDWLDQKNKSFRMVVNAVTIQSAYQAIENMERKNYRNIEIVNISVSRSRNAGGRQLMQAMNPVYVICGEHVIDPTGINNGEY